MTYNFIRYHPQIQAQRGPAGSQDGALAGVGDAALAADRGGRASGGAGGGGTVFKGMEGLLGGFSVEFTGFHQPARL